MGWGLKLLQSLRVTSILFLQTVLSLDQALQTWELCKQSTTTESLDC